MKRIRTLSALAAVIGAAGLAICAVQANQLAGPVITGYVTAIQGTDSITIDGKTYVIAPGSPAVGELGSLSAGQRVDAQLTGPASSPDTEVINVAVHQGE